MAASHHLRQYHQLASLGKTPPTSPNGLRNGLNCDVFIGEEELDLEQRLFQARERRRTLEMQQSKPKWQRSLEYPVIMLLLLILTGGSFLMVAVNVVELLIGQKALPGDGIVRDLGQLSNSYFGSIGTAIQVIVIFYVMAASMVGLHSAPGIQSIMPKPHDTPLSHIISNTTLILVLSSSFPLLARTLGLSNFDLLGDYREIRWLRQFYIVLLYNFLFAGATACCLLKKITGQIIQELYNRLGGAIVTQHKFSIPVKWLPAYPFSNFKNKVV